MSGSYQEVVNYFKRTDTTNCDNTSGASLLCKKEKERIMDILRRSDIVGASR